MKTKYKLILFFICLIPFIAYFLNFKNFSISNDTTLWGSFGDYLNGFYTPIFALIGILVTYYLGIISDRRNQTNMEIEQQKHRPLLHIGYWDADNSLRIYLHNKGNGPLLITKYQLIDSSANSQNRLYDCLPKLESDHYDNYTGDIVNIVLKPDEEFELFLYEREGYEDNVVENRKNIRENFSNYKIQITYKDVYENTMPIAERSLVWFGRHFES